MLLTLGLPARTQLTLDLEKCHGLVNHLTFQNTVPMSTSTPANTHQLASKAKDVKKIPTEFNSSKNKVSHNFGQFLTLQNEGAASCLFVPILVPASKRDVMLSPTDDIADHMVIIIIIVVEIMMIIMRDLISLSAIKELAFKAPGPKSFFSFFRNNFHVPHFKFYGF